METLEMMLYVVVALIVGTVLFSAFGGFDYLNASKDFTKTIKEGKVTDSDGIVANTVPEFADIVLDTWQRCQFGQNPLNQTVYTKVHVDKKELFRFIIQKNACDQLQSLENNCPKDRTGAEHVTGFSLSANTVALIQCSNSGLNII